MKVEAAVATVKGAIVSGVVGCGLILLGGYAGGGLDLFEFFVGALGIVVGSGLLLFAVITIVVILRSDSEVR